ncbi:DHH family phosphoesterase [Halobaculum sp. MBLA0147]|uniref:DHH family phosphoesterase n=1 Tax=Halobaculum sp. MBLA0147 TaxID=3079934 RepID=UPI0035237D22
MKRLVLGAGETGTDVAEACRRRPGETRVVSPDEGHVETLREAGVTATLADPTDPDTYPSTAEVVVVADPDPETAVAAAETAREAFPDATLVVSVPSTADDEERERLLALADRTVDRRRALTDAVRTVTDGERPRRLRRLLATLRSAPEPLAVVTHDNPDPDAIAAAMALVDLAERVGTEAVAGYTGKIAHQENRALVNLLDVDLEHLGGVDVTEAYGSVALVDHAVPGVNDSLSPTVEPLVVIDHHTPEDGVDAPFVDVRPEIGATATMLTEYVETMGIEPRRDVATALTYGIRVDTRDFTRGVTRADFEAAAALVEYVDTDLLDRVESPSVSAAVFEVVAAAIRNRTVEGDVVASFVGELPDRDTLSQAADRLLTMETVTVAVVYGYHDGTVYVSGRARGADVNLGEALRDAFGSVGSAGGHASMAGAQLDLGILGETDDPEQLRSVLEEVVADRLFDTLPGTRRPSTADGPWSPTVTPGGE